MFSELPIAKRLTIFKWYNHYVIMQFVFYHNKNMLSKIGTKMVKKDIKNVWW